jgi:uncharacterized integral membrane protein (TIGR00698 family)
MSRTFQAACRGVPGLALCLAVTAAAFGLQAAEARSVGHPYVEALVLAILLGAVLRTLWAPGPRYQPGITFSAHFVLELAVMLLGASVSVQVLAGAGVWLLAGIAGVVVVAIAASYGIARAFGLPHRMALLIACGNSICGNSAIAAVAPVIGAQAREVAAAIAFTAVLGVVMVLALPLLIPALGLSGRQYGVLAGLTVYAVPQVLAATLPAGALAMQTGTLVKLVRVLMLGPVVLALSLHAGGRGARPSLSRLVPWFILGFLVLGGLRSLGVLPPGLPRWSAVISTALTIVAMAALGLGVDLAAVARAGLRVSVAVVLSLLTLGAISLGLIRALGVP